ncbi:hypothetical protein [Flavobacterium noncentrifugens]|uniref:Uncharacterized protein n=1 Tax=Flavobacterium noncentrifugens TaxID=1128970 RepID=A0A1G8Y2T7_9FLAO|nr:hypothetical protein [Flavobacterium noncentrifugens]SDJ97179.1 hypothetical protein SAMN04487935_2171 [Flavobacterium noncentrifugens]
MKKTMWCRKALILLWLCGMAGCQEKTENLSVHTPALSTSNMLMPVMNSHAAENTAADDAVIYVCKSAGAKRYHFNSNCQALKRCKHKIEQSSVGDAENIGLTMCGYEK